MKKCLYLSVVSNVSNYLKFYLVKLQLLFSLVARLIIFFVSQYFYCYFVRFLLADGRKEHVHLDKITSRIQKLCYGLNMEFVDPVSITFLYLKLGNLNTGVHEALGFRRR